MHFPQVPVYSLAVFKYSRPAFGPVAHSTELQPSPAHGGLRPAGRTTRSLCYCSFRSLSWKRPFGPVV